VCVWVGGCRAGAGTLSQHTSTSSLCTLHPNSSGSIAAAGVACLPPPVEPGCHGDCAAVDQVVHLLVALQAGRHSDRQVGGRVGRVAGQAGRGAGRQGRNQAGGRAGRQSTGAMMGAGRACVEGARRKGPSISLPPDRAPLTVHTHAPINPSRPSPTES
jgi:hypothetical protein